MTQPMVSVWLITYNHEAYIAEAIEGVLKQKTSFPIELVIGEDCSTDGTRAIVQAYKKRYPERIILFLSEANLGMLGILRPTYAMCRGKYVAMLDGDDYWTDPLKLQKQVDQLEKESNARFSFHKAGVLTQSTGLVRETAEPAWDSVPGELRIEDFLRHGNIVPTLSVVFRNDLGPLPEWYYSLPYPDLALYFLLLMHGGVASYLPDTMGIYRLHQGGWFSNMPNQHRYGHAVQFLELFKKYLAPQYQNLLAHELQHTHYELVVMALKEFQLRRAARHWLQLSNHKATTATHRPKGWPHSWLLAGLKQTGQILQRVGLNKARTELL